jgi:predicted HTH transcriptional regulator
MIAPWFATANLAISYDKVPAFIRPNTRMGALIKDIKREDIPEYPI